MSSPSRLRTSTPIPDPATRQHPRHAEEHPMEDANFATGSDGLALAVGAVGLGGAEPGDDDVGGQLDVVDGVQGAVNGVESVR